jgi:hypothetical protein
MRLGLASVCLVFAFVCQASAAPEARVSNQQRFPGGSLKEQISVRVENVAALLQQAQAANTKPVLFLNGREMTNTFGTLAAQPDSEGTGTLLFTLDRDETNRDVWKPLLSRPSLTPKLVTLSVGIHGQQPLPTGWTDFQLTVIHRSWLACWLVAFVFLLILFLKKARETPLLREKGLPNNEAAYSLASCQMAWWFFIVVAAYLFLYMVTWDFNTITTGTLILIGISAGTGFAGAMVDSSKRDQLLAERKKLQVEQSGPPAPPPVRTAQITERLGEIEKELATPRHETFICDVLTDSDGISFHRFQMVIWTLIFGAVFAISVYTDLIMPDFSVTLLGLMGISSGTYIGFKFSETKN